MNKKGFQEKLFKSWGGSNLWMINRQVLIMTCAEVRALFVVIISHCAVRDMGLSCPAFCRDPEAHEHIQ